MSIHIAVAYTRNALCNYLPLSFSCFSVSLFVDLF